MSQAAFSAVSQPLVITTDEGGEPGDVFVFVGARLASLEHYCSGCGIADCDCVDEDLFHPCVGLEGLALLNADAGSKAPQYLYHLYHSNWYLINLMYQISSIHLFRPMIN